MGKMSKKQDRLALKAKIEAAANLYKSKLVGKRFLYVFEGKYIEVIFKKENFRHLTGVDTYLSADRFFKYALQGKLSLSQFWFNEVHPYDLCVRKVQHIGDIAQMATSENFILEEIVTNTQNYRFGTTDLNFTLCMNKELDTQGNEKGDCYVAQSLRDEDCFSKSKNAYIVTHIFSRPNDTSQYTEILFMDKSANMENLPEEVKAMIVSELLPKTETEKSVETK